MRAWRESAACIDKPSQWWLNVRCYDIGRKVCLLECPVCEECLTDQLEYESSVGVAMPGVYGGTTERDRSKRRRPIRPRHGMTFKLTANGHTTQHGGVRAYQLGCRCDVCVTEQRARWRRAKAIA